MSMASISRAATAFMRYYRGALDPKDPIWSTGIPSSFMLGYEAALLDYPLQQIEVIPTKVLEEISILKSENHALKWRLEGLEK